MMLTFLLDTPMDRSSVSASSILMNISPLYVVVAMTRLLKRNTSGRMYIGSVWETSISFILPTPFAASSLARISAPFLVLPYGEAYRTSTPCSSAV